MMSKNINIGIVGAGIQGISNALFLQKKGFHVTVFDRAQANQSMQSVLDLLR
jgi:D-amino-acid dehydrogenase